MLQLSPADPQAKGLLATAGQYEHAAASAPVQFREALARELGQNIGSKAVPVKDQIEMMRIVHLLLEDAEERVRVALASAAATNPAIPHDVAIAIAKDANAVAIPFLEATNALKPSELTGLVHACRDFGKMSAIARRRTLDCSVSAALVTQGNIDVAVTLLGNPEADISETSLQQVLERFGDFLEVQSGLTNRTVLPEGIAAQLIKRTTEEVMERIIARHALPIAVASEIVLETRGKAAVGLCTGLSSSALEALMDSLQTHDMIDAHFLLQSLSNGNLDLFCRCLARLSCCATEDVRRRAADGSEHGIDDLWRSTCLSELVLPRVTAAIGVIVRSEQDCSKHEPATYRMRIIERILTEFDSKAIALDDGESEFMFEIYEKSRHALAHS